MPTYLDIAVNMPQISGSFHYHLPPELEGRLHPGDLVIVPFGKQTVQGVVLGEVEQPAVPETRAVQAILDPDASLTPAQMALARHLSEATLAPLAACVALMLPPGLSQQADTLYTLDTSPPPENLPRLQQRLLALLQKRGPLRGRQIDRAIPRVDWRPSMRGLVRRGWITAQPVLPPPTIQPKHIRTAQLAVPPEQAEASLEKLGRTEATRARRAAMLRALIREGVPVDVAWLYAESRGKIDDLRYLAKKGLVVLGESEVWRDPLEEISVPWDKVPPLTRDQLAIWKTIESGLRSPRGNTPPYLLHGVTGSGKTEIYLRAIAHTIQQGRGAIYLVPEIALTPQTVRRIMARFPGRVGLVHSKLSPGERYDTWRRARAGDLNIIVGPRSALFTPLPDIGLIIVDECHDTSYAQTERPPFYHARQAAVAYARITAAVCILGSATPGVASMYRARQGQWTLLQLPQRILAHKDAVQAHLQRYARGAPPGSRPTPSKQQLPGLLYRHPNRDAVPPAEHSPRSSPFHPYQHDAQTADLPPVRLIDMRQELKAGNRSIFSRALQETLGQTLEQGQQAILFLNRRGTATYVFCRDCGHALKCPRCDEVSLTYHREEAALRCHHCGYRRKMPKKCPNCGSTRIRYYGTGTEQVEAEVRALFPKARTLRWDWDTTRKKGAHEIILSHFANHRADVLIGTQMLSKGLDLPLVTLVGIVLADVGLNLPDYRAGERTFQVLSQVAGRAGRSVLGGQVVLQTFRPRHYVIQAVARHDYASFYARELAYRRELGYPPFGRLVRLEYRHTGREQAEAAARALAQRIRNWLRQEDRRQTELIGPVPCFFSRLDNQYRWQIVLRGPDPVSLLRGKKLLDWRVEVDPVSLL